jgi:alpha-glucosidase
MLTLTGARLIATEGSRVEIGLDRGFRLALFFLDRQLARTLVTRPEGLRMPYTWSLSPELAGDDPLDGRDRLDLTGFPRSPIIAIAETDASITIETSLIRVEVRCSPLALTWSFRSTEKESFRPVLQDRQTQAYQFERDGPGFIHYLARDPAEHYYGLGEKSGDANKHGRHLRMRTTDALGYDAATSDPLYKHIPFYLSVRPGLRNSAVGLFSDNLAHGAFDLGQEIDAYHGPYRSFEAGDGDLDLYVIFGPAVRDVVARYTALTGRTAFPPRWSLSYSGSTMHYTDAPDAEARLSEFLNLLETHGIPCQSFHLSSGYTMRGGKRYVFTWDRDRFPDPARLARRFAERGVRLIANIKPAMLLDHPRFAEVERFHGFVRDSEDESRPHVAQFWGGDAAYLDFTNPQTSGWWSRQVKVQLLDHGIVSTWNDNNEFEIWDDEARVALPVQTAETLPVAPSSLLCDGEKFRETESLHSPENAASRRRASIACMRAVQTGLMLRSSLIAQREHAPMKRPYLISRSGGPGMQRYAQTWTGDNRTDWQTLRYNLRMGHGLSLSGIFNFGHDVGGFAGPKPEPELFMRWIEQGIYWPRFTIHSWNDDGSANEPWMYPEILPLVQAAMGWRERLVPLLYTLMWRAHAYHEPILRPLFYDFPDEAESHEENDAFMVGRSLLVAPIVEPGARSRSVWLPNIEGGWYDTRTGDHFTGGEQQVVHAPLGAAPAFIRAGSMLPLGPSPSWSEGPLTLQLFPLQGQRSQIEIYDDDGESIVHYAEPPCLLHVSALWGGEGVSVDVSRQGLHTPRWPSIQFENPAGEPLAVTANGIANATSAEIASASNQR